MNKATSLFKRILLSPGHFLLFSTYFVFRIYDFNIYEVPFRDFIRPLFLSILIGLVLYIVFGLIAACRWHAAALMTSACLFGFYLYGTFWDLISSTRIIRQPEAFAILWDIFFIILIAWLGWKTPNIPDPNIPGIVNLIAIILLLNPLIGTLVYFGSWKEPFPSQTNHTLQGHPIPDSPDIYYIILDGHTRADVLAEALGHDNGPFIQSLKDLGFYVAECSQSNYENTPQSLTSSLNLDYLQSMSDTFRPGKEERMGLFKLLDNNNVQETISNFGYKTVAFASGFFLAEWRDADVFIAPPHGPITEFETLLMDSSYMRILHDMGFINLDDIFAERYRTRTRLVLNSFDDVVNIPGPKFVFIHLIIPHEPFAFDAMGNPIPPEEINIKEGYLNQVKYIDKAILPNLEILIRKSSTPPVIILQGDHGPWMVNPAAQMKILNAYYLPKGSGALYPSISPVNSFRVVFNEYFGADLPMLEDKSYYSSQFKMYEFQPMPNTCPQ